MAKINCYICKDTGFVVLNKKRDGMIYQFLTTCICELGKQRERDYGNCFISALTCFGAEQLGQIGIANQKELEGFASRKGDESNAK